MLELPIILLPVGPDDEALDACLAALDASTPAGARVWLIDDAQAGPRSARVIEHWIAQTKLEPDYTRRGRAIGESAHLAEALDICGDADVVVLAGNAVPVAGWLNQLQACFARDGAIGTATPWSNLGELASWPRLGDLNALPDEPLRLANALRSMPPVHPELPAAVGHAVLLRGRALRKAGGIDHASYGSWSAALADLSLRLAGFGWRNVLCETAFVGRLAEGELQDGDQDALSVRWPDWYSRMAAMLMHDPLHELREQLAQRVAVAEPLPPQAELFE